VKRNVSLLVLTLLAAGAIAAPPPQDARGRAESRRDEAFKMVDAYIVSQLQESLGLTDAQFVQALPLVKALQTERREYFLGRARLLRDMRRLLGSGSATEAEIVAKLEELKKLDAQGPVRVQQRAAALDAVLTPIQQAKMRVLEVEVEQRMRELVNRARESRPGARSPRE
jgi:Spy/CpxP family protein refolding chaperone